MTQCCPCWDPAVAADDDGHGNGDGDGSDDEDDDDCYMTRWRYYVKTTAMLNDARTISDMLRAEIRLKLVNSRLTTMQAQGASMHLASSDISGRLSMFTMRGAVLTAVY